MLFCGLNNIQNKCNFSDARVSGNRNSCHPVQSVITIRCVITNAWEATEDGLTKVATPKTFGLLLF